jgi:rhodanese-related sulfurtransferase
LEERLDEIPENRDVVLYCRSGKRSQAGALFAADRGFIGETREAFLSPAQAEKGHMRTITKAMRMCLV